MSATSRELDLRSARGERLAGILHEPEGAARGLAVLSPCFTCTRDIAPIRNLARDLADAGYRALRYDPYGSGKSDGTFAEATASKYRDDLVAVAAQLGAGERVHLMGHSLGGAVSLLAASAVQPRSVVTLGSNARKDSLKRLLGDAFERAKRDGHVLFDSGDGVQRPFTRAFAEDLETHDVLGAAERLPCPLLVVHGEKDSLVPLDSARELAARGRADLAIVPGGEHLLARREDRDQIRAAVLAFLERQG